LSKRAVANIAQDIISLWLWVLAFARTTAVTVAGAAPRLSAPRNHPRGPHDAPPPPHAPL